MEYSSIEDRFLSTRTPDSQYSYGVLEGLKYASKSFAGSLCMEQDFSWIDR